jgi:transcriptional regulator with GAF, ATPase, and Fis domain
MLDLPPRELLHALSAAAAEVQPPAILGIVRPDGDEHLSVLYTYVHGIGVHRLDRAEAFAAFAPRGDGIEQVAEETIKANPAGALESHLLWAGVRRLVTAPIPSRCAELLWMGFDDPAVPEPSTIDHLRAVAGRAGTLLGAPLPADAKDDRLRRLETAAELIPALQDALDIRDVFTRLSSISRKAIAHDIMAVGLFSDDLSTVSVYADTGLPIEPGTVLPNHYSSALTRAWEFHLVDDVTKHPLETDNQSLSLGIHSSLRLPIRFGGRVIGGIEFMARDVGKYTTDDVVVARRITDHLALALSHHRLAEESRRSAALRERAASLAMLDNLLSTLTGVLDVREVFDRVSEIARDVLPHDMLALPLAVDGGENVLVYAITGRGAEPPRKRPMPAPHKALLAGAWDHMIYDDLCEHPDERDQPPAQMGYRSSLRLAIRLHGEIVGVLDFSSRQPAFYKPEDVLIGRRIADHIALALSHHRMAEESRRSAALQERTANLEMLDGLLQTLSGVLDVREVFDRVSEIAKKVLPHDAMLIREMTDDPMVSRNYAISGFGDLKFQPESPTSEPHLITEPWDFRIVEDLTTVERYAASPLVRVGLRSFLSLPVRLEGRLAASVTFFSKEPGRFTRDDVLVGRRITDHILMALSHQRLAAEHQRAAALRERAANLEMLDGLLQTLSGVLDIRQVFDRVSEVAQKVLPHDGVTIAELVDGDRHVRLHAATGVEVPVPRDVPVPEPRLLVEPWEFRIIDDVTMHREYADTPPARSGMHSILFVPIRVEGRLWGSLSFHARARGRFTRDDVLIVKRIADHIALAISHQRLAENARLNEELRARTSNLELLDELLAALIDSGDLRDVFTRVSGIAGKVLPHDAAVLMVALPDGLNARVFASAGFSSPLPEIAEIPEEVRDRPDWEHDILDDLTQQAHPRYARMVKEGFQSLMRVPIRRDGKFAGALVFLSRTRQGFKHDDVLIAHRTADRIAVKLARDREFEAAKRADEANARASKLESRVRALTEELDARTGYRRVVGESASWRQVLTQATQVASTETTVLLLGESGTGKEVVARFLHRASQRSTGPFIALNCAALPEQLLEAELFGYERGAYTGATQSKPGQLEQAAGGTLFLDEVAEMSPSAQAKFLRVLQEREFQRLGGTRVLRTDARIVAATNRDLPKSMALGQFREDLYYRLNVFAINLPPLRNRRDDVLPLSEAFLAEIARGLGRPPSGISKDARQQLVNYHWPGNVRELRNILERAAILCEGGLITAEHLSLAPARPAPVAQRTEPPAQVPLAAVAGPPAPTSAGDLQSLERGMIEQALQTARFNKSKAAKALGLTRQQLYVRMRRYGLE